MRFLLDTNTVVALTRRGDRHVSRRLIEHHDQVGLSSIVLHELYFGAFCSDRADFHLATIADLALTRIDFAGDDARVAAEIRATLRRAGTPIGPYDVLIAGQALARDLIVVTNNVREFRRVGGLRVEDWTTA